MRVPNLSLSHSQGKTCVIGPSLTLKDLFTGRWGHCGLQTWFPLHSSLCLGTVGSLPSCSLMWWVPPIENFIFSLRASWCPLNSLLSNGVKQACHFHLLHWVAKCTKKLVVDQLVICISSFSSIPEHVPLRASNLGHDLESSFHKGSTLELKEAWKPLLGLHFFLLFFGCKWQMEVKRVAEHTLKRVGIGQTVYLLGTPCLSTAGHWSELPCIPLLTLSHMFTSR